MKKYLSAILAVLLVAAIAVSAVAFVQKNDVSKTADQLQNDLTASKADVEKLTADNAAVNEALTASKAEVEKLTADNAAVNEALTAAKAEVEKLTADNTAVNEVLTAAKAEVEKLTADNAAVNEALTAAKAEVEKLTADNTAVNEALTAAKAEVKKLTADNAAVNEALTAAKAEVKKLTADNAAVNEALTAAKAEVEKLTADNAAAKAELEKLIAASEATDEPAQDSAADTAATVLTDFGDFTMVLSTNDYYEMAAEKASNTVYAIVYPAYDETSATHNNFNIVWSEMDATAEITLYGAANYASLVQMAAQQQYKSMGINMTDLQVLSATFEDGVGAFITTANLDYTGMGYDVITPQYQLQTYYCMGDAGTYIFTFTATTMEELEALSSYLDSVVFK